jgi:AAA family ATP:ADP antiporter
LQLKTVLNWFGIDVRREERRMFHLFFFYYLVLFVLFYAAKVVRQAMFVDNYSAKMLPLGYLMVALMSFPVMKGYASLMHHLSAKHRIVVLHLVVGGFLMIASFGFWVGWTWVPFVFYILVGLVFGVMISHFWSMTHDCFNERQVRRLFGLLAAGGALGGLLGAYLVPLVLSRFSLSVLMACCGLVVVLMMWFLMDVVNANPEGFSSAADDSEVIRNQWNTGKNKLIQWIAIVMGLSIMVAQIVDLQFSWAVEQATDNAAKRFLLFGNFYALISISALFFQLGFSQHLIRRLGIQWGIRVLPLTLMGGSLFFVLGGLLWPLVLIPAACFLKISEGGLRHSFEQVTRELLFSPLPRQLRRSGKAFVDVFVQRFSKGISALLLMPVALNWLTPVQVSALAVMLIGVWLSVTGNIKREYLRSFRMALKREKVFGRAAMLDASGMPVSVLMERINSPEPAEVLFCLVALQRRGLQPLISPFLLYHPVPEVFLKVLSCFQDSSHPLLETILEAKMQDPDLRVRLASLAELSRRRPAYVTQRMETLLEAKELPQRSLAAGFFLGNREHVAYAKARTVFQGMLHGEPAERMEATKLAMGLIPEERVNAVIRLLFDSDPVVLQHMLLAMKQAISQNSPGATQLKNPLFVPRLISLLGQSRHRVHAAQVLVFMGEIAIEPLIHFMKDERENRLVRRSIPLVLSQIGGKQALQWLIQAVDPDDLLLRQKIIEAIGTIVRANTVVLSKYRQTLMTFVHWEVCGYLQKLMDFLAVGGWPDRRDLSPLVFWDLDQHTPQFLAHVLSECMKEHIESLFYLLEMLSDSDDMVAIRFHLLSRDTKSMAMAMELLENALQGDLRRLVFAALGDAPLREKLAKAERQFALKRESEATTVARLLKEGDVRLVLAAIHHVQSTQLRSCLPRVQSLLQHEVALIRSTAAWALKHLEEGEAHEA